MTLRSERAPGSNHTAPVVVATRARTHRGEKRHVSEMGTSGNRKSIGRAVPSRFATYLRGSACTPAALRTHGLSPGVGHRGSLREERASRGRRRALVVPASPERTTTPRENAPFFSLDSATRKRKSVSAENADRTSVFRPRSGTVSDAARGEEWSTPPLDRHDARNRPSTDRPRPRRGVGALSMTSGSRAAENPGTTRVCEKDPKKRWRGRRARSACLAGRVGFSGSTKIK